MGCGWRRIFGCSGHIKSSRVIAFDDLGNMEAIHEFVVEDMPVTVAVDSEGTMPHIKQAPGNGRSSNLDQETEADCSG